MRLAVFGLGYVGSVTAACLAADGHQVTGVDPHSEKVRLFNSGIAPVREPGLDELIMSGISSGSLSATSDPRIAVHESDAALVCVGTPSRADGSIDLGQVGSVASEIGKVIGVLSSPYTVIIRSTVLPGTTRDLVTPALEKASTKVAGTDFEVCFNPEFLREGSSISDYREPSKIVVGTDQGKPNQVVEELYNGIDSPRYDTVFEIAELAKYIDNTWHALKVSFANEVGRIAKGFGVDGRDAMTIMTGDTKLNMSPLYLRPGFAYGGSCLPKDVAALEFHTRRVGLELPLISAIPVSNNQHIESALGLIRRLGSRRTGLLGLTFKPNTDDLRNSPLLELARRLVGEGVEVRIYDPNVDMSHLLGANKTFVEENLPGLEDLLVDDPQMVVGYADTVVLGKNERSLVDAALTIRPEQHLVDLIGMEIKPRQGGYVGIGW